MVQIADPQKLLSFWHQVEFFIPFDLESSLDGNHRGYRRDELESAASPSMLWNAPCPPSREIGGFTLFAGIFSVREADGLMQTLFPGALSDDEAEENRERLANRKSARTCHAVIHLDSRGRPLWERTSISTLPWALGQLSLHQDPARLDFDAYMGGEQALKTRLEGFRCDRTGNEDDTPPPLTGGEIVALTEIFLKWSGFRPAPQGPGHPMVAIQPWYRKARRKRTSEDDRETSPDAEVEIDILNSFFARDLARVIGAMREKAPLGALEPYLRPAEKEKRIDLYGDRGRQALFTSLLPNRLPPARWPAEDEHNLSLMQQFAVNHVFETFSSDEAGLFSVNGPPGTGKTTLLRDLIAAILTQRARILATLETPDQAFAGDAKVVLQNGQSRKLRHLIPQLTGFEMVVASYNNVAVENISADLPKASALGGSCWREEDGQPRLGYLRPVAVNIAARNRNGDYRDLKPDDMPWGLIAAVLGKKQNRHDFKEKCFFQSGHRDQQPHDNYDPDLHQDFWTWRKGYRQAHPGGFEEARQAFLKLDQRVRTRLEKRQLQVSAYLAQRELDHHERKLKAIRLDLQHLQARRPGFWRRWFTRSGRAAHRQYRQERAALRKRLRQCVAKRQATEKRRHEIETRAGGPNRLQRLIEELPPVRAPFAGRELEESTWQIQGLWGDPTLDHLRAELFGAALKLHEAWVAEASWEQNLFSLSDLLDGRGNYSAEQVRLLWQSLFMLVPVVSSTLASVGSQFSKLRGGDLGWLFIDEAGQAPPQAAVGALWRARRAVIVGDPQQIEPVFTVPVQVVKGLAQFNGIEATDRVSPHQVSVQILADAANPVGAMVDFSGSPQWLGSPLRVHRRCLSPMFDISNVIGYGGKMIQATPAETSDSPSLIGGIDIGPSAWVDLSGTLQGRHLIAEQAELVIQALETWLEVTGRLPPLYIITPFREIRENLLERLKRNEALEKWGRTRIGTVHSFQGKEEEMVWMVLGCSTEHPGAAYWASGKPNLLNVALTRARKRFFMIGERNLWGSLPYFREADGTRLPSLSATRFLARISHQGG